MSPEHTGPTALGLDHCLDSCHLAGEIIPCENGPVKIVAYEEAIADPAQGVIDLDTYLQERDAKLPTGHLDEIKQALRETIIELAMIHSVEGFQGLGDSRLWPKQDTTEPEDTRL